MGIDQALWNPRHRTAILVSSAALVLGIAVADWSTAPYVSFGFLYLFPVLLSAAFLPRWFLGLLGVGCAGLSSRFSNLPLSPVRLAFESLALIGCGLFVHELSRNRRLAESNREQLRVLIGTSPAAIVTVDHQGLIEQANEAAGALLRPRGRALIGSPIAAFVPELHYALRLEAGPQFRSALECRAHRGDSESFPAEIWFSTWTDGKNPKLAAIIADVSEETFADRQSPEPVADAPKIELTPREGEILSFIVQGLANKEIADRLNVSESTVKNNLQGLFNKTGVRSRSQLVRVALEQFRSQI